MLTTIAERKFALPDLPEPCLTRGRLLGRLAAGQGAGKRLTVVRGGPGTGKTTLVADYARNTGLPVFWFGLTPAERDPVVFFGHLAEGLRRRFPDLSGQPGEVIETLGQGGLAQAAALLCDALVAGLPGASIVVLDDSQYLSGEPGAIEALEVLVRFFPEDSQLVLCGRVIPGLKLSQYQIKGQILAIEDADLALDRDETEALIRASKDDPSSPDVVERVFGRTQGWITGVVHALASPADSPVESLESPEVLYAYLAEELFDSLAPAFRDGLLRCAYLPRLDPEACRAVLGTGADRFLAEIKEHRTFVGRIGEALAFNPIFLEFLRREADSKLTHEERSLVLRRLASDPGTPPEEAVGYLLQARDWPEAETALADCAPALFKAGRTATVLALVDGFPASWRQDSAWLNYLLGELARRDGNLARALDLLGKAEAIGSSQGTSLQLGWIQASLAAVFGAQGDVNRQSDTALRALDLLPERSAMVPFCLNILGMAHFYRNEWAAARGFILRANESFREVGDTGGQMRSLHNLGLVHASEGDLERGIAFYRESIRCAEAGHQVPFPLTYNNLALCELYLGRPAAAWAAIERGFALAERLSARRDRLYLLRTLGHANLHRGEPPKAREQFETALNEAIETGDRLNQAHAHLGLAEAALGQGETKEARLAVEQAVHAAGRALSDPGMLEAATLQAEIELRCGDLDGAERWLNHLAAVHSESPNPYREFHIERLWAGLCDARGDRSGAVAHAASRAALAERFGYPLPEQAPESPGSEAGPAAAARVVAGADPAALEIRSLGAVEVKVHGQARTWRTGNAKVVLVFFLMHPSGATTEKLRELLYPDGEPSRSAIHMAINRLRTGLEPDAPKGAPSRFILFQDGRYFFNRGVDIRFDVADFRQFIRQARQPGLPDAERSRLLAQAVELYRGPFMDEYPDLAWCQLERESMRRQAQEAYEGLFALAGARDDWTGLERLADANLDLEPCSQTACRAKLVALAMQERADDALRFGALAGDLYLRTFGDGPDPETAELADLIRDGRLTVRAARSSLPDSW